MLCFVLPNPFPGAARRWAGCLLGNKRGNSPLRGCAVCFSINIPTRDCSPFGVSSQVLCSALECLRACFDSYLSNRLKGSQRPHRGVKAKDGLFWHYQIPQSVQGVV